MPRIERKRRELLGGRLRRLRSDHGISQRQLGELVGVSGTTICDWENGKTPMRYAYVMIFAHIFEVDEEYLCNADYRHKGKTRSQFSKEIEDFAQSLSSKQRDALLQWLICKK